MIDVLELIGALKKPHENFSASLTSLRAGRAETFADRRIALYSGGFGYTVRFRSGSKQLALKFFKRPNDYRREIRYRVIGGSLSRNAPAWFVPVAYRRDALRVGTRWVDCLAMPWREGTDLATHMARACQSTPQLVALASELWWLFIDLRRRRAAPVDAHPGNFRVDGLGRVFLLDYDSLFVPGLESVGTDEPGMRSYVCPSRPRGAFGPESGDFALWLIYASVLALLVDPSLVDLRQSEDDLLFTADDISDPQRSAVLRRVSAHPRAELRELGSLLSATLSLEYRKIPSVTLLPCPSSPQRIGEWLRMWRAHCAMGPPVRRS